MGRGMSLEDRFWAKVDKGGPDECWLWTGALSRGYGNLVIGHSGNRYAHRVAWELMVGPYPSGCISTTAAARSDALTQTISAW